MRKYDVASVDAFIAQVHEAVGDAPFRDLGLMALEALVRSHDASRRMPGKTLLRERLNAYRSKRWPQTAPKRVGSYRYW